MCLLNHRERFRRFHQMFAWLPLSPPSALSSNVTFLKAFPSDTKEDGILPCSPQPLIFLIPVPAPLFFIVFMDNLYTIYFVYFL